MDHNISATSLKGEEWRPIAGYDGIYEVSSLGRVKSVARIAAGAPSARYPDGFARQVSERLLRPALNSTGRLTLGLHRNGKRSSKTVPGLVAGAFIGPKPKGHVIAHLNGNHLDCRATNLRYDCDDKARRQKIGEANRKGVWECPFGSYDSLSEAVAGIDGMMSLATIHRLCHQQKPITRLQFKRNSFLRTLGRWVIGKKPGQIGFGYMPFLE